MSAAPGGGRGVCGALRAFNLLRAAVLLWPRSLSSRRFPYEVAALRARPGLLRRHQVRHASAAPACVPESHSGYDAVGRVVGESLACLPLRRLTALARPIVLPRLADPAS